MRELASAFNDMQARIRRLIGDRTQALAAVSHDLKTPITRLRLKIEALRDKKLAASIESDLSEMEQMLDQTLAYLRGERDDEVRRKLDLGALLQTLVDAASDSGRSLRFLRWRSARHRGRPLALKRAFANLIDNAAKYGGVAHVFLQRDEDAAVVRIDDEGPGIPPDDIERAFEAFVRLSDRATGRPAVFGLGLAIARTAIMSHGGSLVLATGPKAASAPRCACRSSHGA